MTDIFERCMNGTATAAEREALFEWMAQAPNRDEATALLEAAFRNSDGSLHMDSRKMEGMITAILDVQKPVVQENTIRRVNTMRRRVMWWAAASILVIVAAWALWQRPSKTPGGNVPFVVNNDIAPARAGAVLTLADGTQVALDSAGSGVIASQNGSQVVLQNGRLSYQQSGSSAATVTYNMVATPKGMQYNIVLPDGTRAWLNAASSLRYPTQFSGADRRVEATGEVYFEVAQDAQRPFFVALRGKSEIQVLGTSFNVNAYEDEPAISTTLLTGTVRMTAGHPGGGEAVLRPGEQARLVNIAGQGPQKLVLIRHANIDKALAWKNGVFDFDGAKLEDVMKQVARWYNIEVVYENGIPQKEFVGKMSRDISLAGLLRALEDAEVRFRLEGRRLTVIR